MFRSTLCLIFRLIPPLTLALPTAEAIGQCTAQQSCLTVHGPGGCDSVSCCTAVCTLDPTCCSAQWDADCVATANSQCIGYCGAAASGSCLSSHANPSCDNGDCCQAVCAIDPFCCSAAWDATCVQFAGFACTGSPGTCGQTSESCFQPHTQGACDDLACCNAVCQIDPTCCSQSWDQLCVYAAEQTCVTSCQPSPDPNVQEEIEGCENRLNDPCYVSTGGTPESMVAGIQKRGTLGIAVAGTPNDVDVYDIVVPDPDGDGIAKITLRFASSPTAWAAVLPGTGCAPMSASVAHISSALCVDADSAPICVPAGSYRIVVSAGAYPAFGGADVVCGSGNIYTVKLEVSQTCAACTAGTGSCFAPKDEPGCALPTCCAAVCGVDPFCCDGAWDADCVGRAASLCVTAPPANDTCKGATTIRGDTATVNTAGSTLESGALTNCGQAALTRDVWLSYDADVSGVVAVETCGTWFDTVVAVYRGTCGAPEIIACSDDATGCTGTGASRAPFTAVCGERYLIRVGPKAGQAAPQGGDLTVRIVRTGLPPCGSCIGDLDLSGAVDAQDITILLSGWGSPSGDVTGDGTTNAQDVAALLNAWGACPV